MKKTMKAANLYAPADIRVEQVAVPEPGEGEVLIRVKAVGVCGSDVSRLMETGTYTFPTIPGHEFGGEIVGLGAGVEDVPEGARVTVIPLIPCMTCEYCLIGEYTLCREYDYLGSRCDGAYAEYVKAPAKNVLLLPDDVDFEMAAMTDPISVALHAVKKLGIQPGDRVAVFGVGPIGFFSVQWAKALGAGDVIAVDIFPEKLAAAGAVGADVCINARETDAVAAIKELTDGKGVERSLEFAGSPITQEQCIRATAALGSTVWGGISHQPLNLSEQAVDDILRKELVIRGSWNSSFAPFVSDWENALAFMGRGKIVKGDVITHRLSLDELPDAIQMMLERKTDFNKVMFFP
ncbi:MAG: galactitol-1-phosphate 5-dehydrogenase [Kiritimatiellae bacterium]|nr:galactitol-1-phosphate 5-dehydrogenase [Kiritimatiellia bacterium]